MDFILFYYERMSGVLSGAAKSISLLPYVREMIPLFHWRGTAEGANIFQLPTSHILPAFGEVPE